MITSFSSLRLLEEIVDRINAGVFVVNKNYELVLWNSYMENYSQHKANDVLGKNIFTQFPELPTAWLEQKIHNVFVLKNFSFTSWEHRPYLFKFLHNRPITGGIDYMRQNCTFLPIKGETEDIEFVCVTLVDVTDTSIYENMLKSAVKSLAEASNRDGLTNIYNRRFLEQTMSKEFARIKRYGGKLSFIIIDLDHFKAVNDSYGHLAGDEILKVTAKRLTDCLRSCDILARYGGEEFAVLLPETPMDGAKILADRLCLALSQEPVLYDGIEISTSGSLGVSELQENMETHEDLISQADEAMYLSKENGRNQVTIYDNKTSTLIPPGASNDNTNINNSHEQEQPVTVISDLEENPEITANDDEVKPVDSQTKEVVEAKSKLEPEPEPEPEPEIEPEPEPILPANDDKNSETDLEKNTIYVTIGHK